MKLSDEIQKLEKEFHLYFCRINTIEHHINGIDLLEKPSLDRLFALLERNLNTDNPVVLASLFAKYYSYLLLSGSMYCVTNLNIGIDFSLNNVVIGTDDKWRPIIQLLEPKAVPFSEDNRAADRDKYLRMIFKHNLQPVFAQLSKQTGITLKTLWGHAAYSLQFLYVKWEKEAQSEELASRVQADHLFLTSAANVELFGIHKGNPLKVKFKKVTHPLHDNEMITLRSCCCLRYKLPDTDNCTTCPLLNEDQRKGVVEKYLAGQLK